MKRAAPLAALVLALAACGDSGGPATPSTVSPRTATTTAPAATTAPSTAATAPPATTAPASSPPFRARKVLGGFDRPDWVGSPPDDQRLFVIEQHRATIWIVKDGKRLAQPFLKLPESVAQGNEQGLLGLAFHPDFARNGRFVVDYTNGHGDTRIVEFTAPGGGDTADASSAKELLAIPQPYANHNGGDVVFGPDGMLWIGMGDGGSGGDPENRAQNPNELLGKLLRIDVDHPSGGKPYGIPASNPYARGGGRPEIWAIGLRNPWRFSFAPGGLLWIGDVGQNAVEEIDRVRYADAVGSNFGWRLFEGNSTFEDGASKPARYVGPVATYPHDASGSCSVTGGLEYRGWYVYADYCSAKFWALEAASAAPRPVEITDRLGSSISEPSSFGFGGDGGVYVASLGGTIWRLDAA